ncbi:MAG: aspartate carbamoyltransferase [Ectothiorhodospiraceae bacterium]|nr:aspartate carbamoyltransferase [Chromatiales bacterium]MCP5155965.1 aspartate carbamoyltransferase [Ectothiorhodospiraceae bacterium]
MQTANLSRAPAPERAPARLFHILDPRVLTRAQLDELCDLTTRVRILAKSRIGARILQTLLPHKRAMLYFVQPSTRTFMSFNNACHILGIRTSEIRDPSTSSEVKGESFDDSIRTFSSYVDVIIMRASGAGLAAQAAAAVDASRRPIPIINAGSGQDQHPTQALLDIYTLERSFEHRGGIEGKTIGFMGDLRRGRTVRSLAYLMTNYPGVRLVFIAPAAFQISDDIKSHLRANGVEFSETDSLHEVLPGLDAIYLTRLQTEWDVGEESASFDHRRYSFGPSELGRLKPEGVVLHPLPRGPELDPSVDADPRAVYWRQERNGMWMRVALLVKIFGVEDELPER